MSGQRKVLRVILAIATNNVSLFIIQPICFMLLSGCRHIVMLSCSPVPMLEIFRIEAVILCGHALTHIAMALL